MTEQAVSYLLRSRPPRKLLTMQLPAKQNKDGEMWWAEALPLDFSVPYWYHPNNGNWDAANFATEITQ